MRPLTKFIYTIIGLFLIVTLFLAWNSWGARLSDEEAIRITTSLSDRLNVKYSHQLSVKRKGPIETLVFGTDAIPIVFSESEKIIGFVSRNQREITNLHNPEAMHRVLYQLGPEYSNTSRPFQNKDITKLFINEKQAITILLELAEIISLPKDTDHPEIWLDKDYGYWTAKWKRTYGGYSFEKDNITISIVAVNGEFSSYNKTYKARPCSTIVKVQKSEAVGIAFKEFVDYFSSEWWEKNKDKFELLSAELKIVKPDEYWRKLIPFYEAESRLAWVVAFDVKKGQENFILSKDPSVIKVDAATKKVFSSEINIP